MSPGSIAVTVRLDDEDQHSTLLSAFESILKVRPDCEYEVTDDLARFSFDGPGEFPAARVVWSAIARCQAMLVLEAEDEVIRRLIIHRSQLSATTSGVRQLNGSTRASHITSI